MNRRGFLGLFTRAAAAAPFVAMLPRWYGTAAQWAVHAKEGALRLAAQGRLAAMPDAAWNTLRTSKPYSFSAYRLGPLPPGERWIGHWSDTAGRIVAFTDRTGRSFWAKP